MRRLVSLLSLLSMVVVFGVACSDPVSPASCSGTPNGSNNCAASYDSGTPNGSNN
jgi:hypothetical protein